MDKKQILALFVCSLVPWTVGNGLVPLLPVYAMQLGAAPAAAGYYMAFSYFALAVGTVAAGWLSDRLGRRKMPLIVAGLAGVPIAWLIGRMGNIWGLSVLTAMLWFCGGLGFALIGILTGLFAGEDERGKIFGILSLASGLGAAIGGLMMSGLGFGAMAIASTGIVGGIVAMPLPFLVGWLSEGACLCLALRVGLGAFLDLPVRVMPFKASARYPHSSLEYA